MAYGVQRVAVGAEAEQVLGFVAAPIANLNDVVEC